MYTSEWVTFETVRDAGMNKWRNWARCKLVLRLPVDYIDSLKQW